MKYPETSDGFKRRVLSMMPLPASLLEAADAESNTFMTERIYGLCVVNIIILGSDSFF